GDHLTGVDLKLYVGERLDGTEPLGDPALRQHGRSGHKDHLLRRLTRRGVVQLVGWCSFGAPRFLRGCLSAGRRRSVWQPVRRGSRFGAPVRQDLGTAYLKPILSQAALYLPAQTSWTV